MTTESFDCRTCGACCHTLLVEVAWDDPVPPKYVKDDRLCGPVMRTRQGRCMALRGTLGPNGCVSCRIYTQRPSVCRDFLPGSEFCLTMRQRAGFQDSANLPPTTR